MNTHVNFEIAKLLKEKGYDIPAEHGYDSNGMYYRDESHSINYNTIPYSDSVCSAPTIAEVVMWLYEKHGIWIYTKPNLDEDGEWIFKGYVKLMNDFKSKEYQTGLERQPTEAYSEAIEYTLKKLI